MTLLFSCLTFLCSSKRLQLADRCNFSVSSSSVDIFTGSSSWGNVAAKKAIPFAAILCGRIGLHGCPKLVSSFLWVSDWIGALAVSGISSKDEAPVSWRKSLKKACSGEDMFVIVTDGK